MPAGYAFAVLPLVRPMTRSSAFMKVAAGAEMNSGLCTATYGRLSGFDSCAITIADPNRATVPTSASATTEDFIDRPSYLLARPFVEHQCPAGLAMLVSCEHLGQTTDEIRSRQPLRGCQRFALPRHGLAVLPEFRLRHRHQFADFDASRLARKHSPHQGERFPSVAHRGVGRRRQEADQRVDELRPVGELLHVLSQSLARLT